MVRLYNGVSWRCANDWCRPQLGLPLRLPLSSIRRLAELWGARFGRLDVARRCYERALELEADAANKAEILSSARKLLETSAPDDTLLALVLGGEAEASSASSPCPPPPQRGPTAWMTWRAGRSPAPVVTAPPVGQPTSRGSPP